MTKRNVRTGPAEALESEAKVQKTKDEQIAELTKANEQLTAVLQRTAAAISRKGAELGTWGAELNKLLGI